MFREYLLAFSAGVITFLSPCVLPLIPAYIFYITGLKADSRIENRFDYTAKILLFILGFTLVFMTLGLLTGILSFAFQGVKQILNIIFGIIVIVFALHFMGLFNIFFLNYEKRLNIEKIPSGYLGPLLLGMAFAAGWTPCVGPVLGSILGLVASGSSIIKGAVLLFIFSMGLGLLFLVTALFFNSLKPLVDFLKRNSARVKFVSGIILFIIGLLILSGTLNNLNILLAQFAYFLEASQPASDIIFSFILLSVGLMFVIIMFIKKKFSITLTIFSLVFILLFILVFFFC